MGTTRSKSRSSVRVHHHDTAWGAPGDGGSQRGNGELGGHPLVDRVANYPVGEQVFDRAAVDLALGGGMRGDVGDPHLVRRQGSDVPQVNRTGCPRRPGHGPASNSSWERSGSEVGGRAAQDLVLLLEAGLLPAQLD